MDPLAAELTEGYSFVRWTPSLFQSKPSGLKGRVFTAYWLMHLLRIFRSPDYSIFLIYYGNEIAHYSVVMPGSFRYPFMNKNELQIGPIGTHEAHRGKRLATYAINKIIAHYQDQDRTLWYLTRATNEISIRTIERFGFTRYCTGHKEKIAFLPFITHYKIDSAG